MSKPSRRPNREQIKEQRKEKKRAEKELRAREKANGLNPRSPAALPNTTSSYDSVGEEREARTDAVTGQMRIFKEKLPFLLKQLSKIPDPRNPKKTKHKMTLLFIYGILMFVFQFTSRREVNREMTRPMFKENLKLLFPELETLPHADTLFRLLSQIDVNEIEQAHLDLVRKLIRKKKFTRHLIEGHYPIVFDGTQKFKRNSRWDVNALERSFGKGDQSYTQYYVYILEVSLAFQNGMTIPLISEFLEYGKGDTDNDKQDCELRAFKRLAKRLKKEFPRLRIVVLLDGIYANGPVMAQVSMDLKWQFMIVLKDGSLPSVWDEVRDLRPLQVNNRRGHTWGNRRQKFWWVSDIEYEFSDSDSGRKRLITVHVVVCEEEWQEVDEKGQEVTKTSRHVWLSSQPLNRDNVHERCNLGARSRWGIESQILVEKCHGYQYEHCFSYDWNAMKGYHFLMHIARLFHILARYSRDLVKFFRVLGVRGFIKFVRETCAAPWLIPEEVEERFNRPFQIRLE